MQVEEGENCVAFWRVARNWPSTWTQDPNTASLKYTVVLAHLRTYVHGYVLVCCVKFHIPIDAHLQRFVTGATSCKRGGAYRPVDFDGLLRQARAARQRDGKRLARVKQLSKKGKLSRECGLLRVHKELWETEQARLQTQREEVLAH